MCLRHWSNSFSTKSFGCVPPILGGRIGGKIRGNERSTPCSRKLAKSHSRPPARVPPVLHLRELAAAVRRVRSEQMTTTPPPPTPPPPPPPPLRIAIAGAGISGSILASQLAKHPNATVCLIERFARGALPPGLNLLPNHNGMAALRALDPHLAENPWCRGRRTRRRGGCCRISATWSRPVWRTRTA